MYLKYIALAIWALSLFRSVLAWPKARSMGEVPMQWGVDGSVNWSAPPAVALLMIPLTAGVLLAVLYFVGADQPTVGYTMVAISVVFAIISLVHLHFALAH